MTDIPSVLLLFHCFHSEIIVTVTEYLAVRPGSAPGDWAVIPGMYGTHLKYGHVSSTNFNNLGSCLTRVVGVVWDVSIIGDNWCSLT